VARICTSHCTCHPIEESASALCWLHRMASSAAPRTVQSSPFKSSSTSTKHALSSTLTRSRSRKVQPALKQRAEAFLAQAAADTDSTTKSIIPSRKRKRGSIDPRAKEIFPMAPETGPSTSTPVRKRSITSKVRSEPVQDRSDASKGLVFEPRVNKDETEPPMPRSQPKKSVKAKAGAEANEPAEKRLKIFRKQAPKTFHEKLHRAISQRYALIMRIC
jgi:hypothetical protein